MHPYRFGVPVCSATVTAERDQIWARRAPSLAWFYAAATVCCILGLSDVGQMSPPHWFGYVVLPAASVCGTRVCSRVCVYAQVPERIWQRGKCKGSVCESLVCVVLLLEYC